MRVGFSPYVAFVLVVVVAACGAGIAGPSAPGSHGLPASPGSGDGLGTPGPEDPVSGAPGDGGGGPGDIDPIAGQPKLVIPKPGQQDVHPVAIEELVARVAGRHAVVNAIWYSGVEPCAVLDSVVWELDPGTMTISVSVREGHGAGDVACIEIALQKATVIDLGDLDPGTYTVTAADGIAPDISFDIE